jgi:hypothetical protein
MGPKNGAGEAMVVESSTAVPAPTSAGRLDVEAIRVRCEAATPGPWYTEDPGPYTQTVWSSAWPPCESRVADFMAPADALFLVHARTDLPAALDEIDRLRADLAIANEASAELLYRAATFKVERDRLQELLAEGQAAYDELLGRLKDLERATGERSGGV